MKEIKESKIGKLIGYVVKDSPHDKGRIVCNSFIIEKINDKQVIIFTDSDHEIRKDFNDYINRPVILNMSPGYVRKTCYHLRIFADFLDIFKLSATDMKDECNADLFVSFILGTLNIQDCTIRSNAYCNKILITVRDFLSWAKINSALHDSDTKREGYKYSLTEKNKHINPVMYLGKAEIVKLRDVILNSEPYYSKKFIKTKKEMDDSLNSRRESIKNPGDTFDLPEIPSLPDYDEQGYLIFRLALNRGLRLGEILGITCEDLTVKTGSDGTLRKGVYLRNRCSDYDYQFSKELLHPFSEEAYSSRDYNKSNVGTSFISLDDTTWNLLQKIVNRDLPIYDKAYPDKIEEVKADSVSGLGNNYYIFRSLYGGRLSDQTWNRRLKRFFIKAGLDVDSGRKETNLTHKLRHSFAMMFVKDANASPVWLASVLRHKSVDTVKAYLNPTVDDVSSLLESYDNVLEDDLLEFLEKAKD